MLLAASEQPAMEPARVAKQRCIHSRAETARHQTAMGRLLLVPGRLLHRLLVSGIGSPLLAKVGLVPVEIV